MAKNVLDFLEDSIAARIKPRGMGNVNRAGSGGVIVAIPTTSTRVENGIVKEEWQVGDEFSDRFYFREATE